MLRLTLANEVSFDVDSAVVKPAFQPTLAKVAEVLTRYGDNQVTIVGHTDSTGSEVYNQSLSQRRAAAVLAELRRLGVPPSRLQALGQGESEPRASNATPAGSRTAASRSCCRPRQPSRRARRRRADVAG
jgi:outer membrane protein OmpA-like peptidoglycan-associated protein